MNDKGMIGLFIGAVALCLFIVTLQYNTKISDADVKTFFKKHGNDYYFSCEDGDLVKVTMSSNALDWYYDPKIKIISKDELICEDK
jgi:hypothetical protein